MSRMLVAALTLLTLALPLHAAEGSAARENPAVQVAHRLGEPITFPAITDVKATLKDALAMLAAKANLSIEVNEEAFTAASLDNIEEMVVAGSKPFPEMKNARLDRVLRRLLMRVSNNEVRATWVVRREGIEITTEQARQAEFWPNGLETTNPIDTSDTPTRYMPLVVVEFDKRPLDEALRELADSAGYNVVLDARLADKAKVQVTGTLINVPLDTAVRIVADMADLRPVLLNNAIYVTSEARAEKMQSSLNSLGGPNPGVPVPIGGLGIMGVQPGMGIGGGVPGMGAGMGALGAAGGFGGGIVGFAGGLGSHTPPARPTVKARIKGRPFAEAVQELVAGSSIRVVLDIERVGDRAKALLTANLEDVPVETALRIAAEMVELQVVFLDNVAFITTKEKARSFRESLEKR